MIGKSDQGIRLVIVHLPLNHQRPSVPPAMSSSSDKVIVHFLNQSRAESIIWILGEHLAVVFLRRRA